MKDNKNPSQLKISNRLAHVLDQLESVTIFDKNRKRIGKSNGRPVGIGASDAKEISPESE